jgi:RES domain
MKLTVFRHAAYDTPWWTSPSSVAGRFHRAGQDTVQYLSLHPLGPAAEMLRHHVGPSGDPDDVLLNLWTAVVDIDDVMRVDFDDCDTYGRTADELVGDDYTSTQALADAARASGATAMIVPSAALPGTHNLILFGNRVLHPFLWEPITPEEIPTGHLSDGARVPAEVAEHVRWRGTPHKAVEQWKAAGAYDLFDDPAATRRLAL